MKRTVLVRFLLVPVFIFGLVGFSQAQDLNEAKEGLNTALGLQKTDPESGIASVKECLDICDQIGEEATDVKVLAENLLPKLYYEVGYNLVKEKKNAQAIPAFKEALKAGEQYNNTEIVSKCKSMLPKLYNSIGGSYYKKQQFDKALESLAQAVVYDPDYAKAYYTTGLVYKKMNDAANFESTMDKGLVAAANSKDTKTKGQITKAAIGFFLTEGTQALSDKKPADAVSLLGKVLKYDPKDFDTYFYLASSLLELKKYDEAVEASNKALALGETDDEKNAKHYYNLGLAFKGKGDKNAACEAFNKALFGQFKANAQYEIEHGVKCNE